MALSQRKTTIARLRGVLGPFHGREDNFAKLAKRSPSWVKKTSAGITPLSEETARLLHVETGVSLEWLLMGPPDIPPVNWRGEPYDLEVFEWHRAGIKSGQPRIIASVKPFHYVPTIAAIGSAAGDKGYALLFAWKLESFLKECAKEFGFDDVVRAKVRALVERKRAPQFIFHDKAPGHEKQIDW